MRGRWHWAWFLGAAAALTVAVLLPPLEFQRRMPDVIAIVDITQSMNVMDERLGGRAASRLAFVKRALIDAVETLPCGSKLGLGIFTEYRPFVLSLPVDTCQNRAELEENIDHINGQMAWAGESQIAKGVYTALRTLKVLGQATSFALLTDGHEAPPVNPRHRLDLSAEAGAVRGVLIGVGGATPEPIPKFDREGNAAGVWGAEDVMQTDVYSRGRQGTEAGEMMAEADPAGGPAKSLQGTPGREQLSALHEEYLETLAAESRLGYARLSQANELGELLSRPQTSAAAAVATDVRWAAATLALLLLLGGYFPRRRLRSPPVNRN